MKTLFLVLGLIFFSGGIFIKYSNEYLARKQKELEQRGIKNVNLYWSLVGPRPYLGPAFIITGLGFLLLFFLREFGLL